MSGVNRRIVLVSAAVAAVVAVLVGAGTLAWANHQFPDVPTTSPFHDDISSFVDAGCATGFPGNTFRPQDEVKRQQLARFFAACGGRVEYDETNGNVALSGNTLLADVTIEAGALGGNGGFVLFMATIEIQGSAAGTYPCQVDARLTDLDLVTPDVNAETQLLSLTENSTLATETEHGSMIQLVPVEPGETIHHGLTALLSVFGGCTATITASGDVAAIYIPFPGDA